MKVTEIQASCKAACKSPEADPHLSTSGAAFIPNSGSLLNKSFYRSHEVVLNLY